VQRRDFDAAWTSQRGKQKQQVRFPARNHIEPLPRIDGELKIGVMQQVNGWPGATVIMGIAPSSRSARSFRPDSGVRCPFCTKLSNRTRVMITTARDLSSADLHNTRMRVQFKASEGAVKMQLLSVRTLVLVLCDGG
jgi:hypothetical protein